MIARPTTPPTTPPAITPALEGEDFEEPDDGGPFPEYGEDEVRVVVGEL
jgi:hypothetical protein